MAHWALARKAGQDPPSGPVPFTYLVRQVARSWGVPPWIVSGEEPTPEVIARWFRLDLVFGKGG